MGTRQVISTSLLSKRWNSLWRFNPYLNFIFDETWEKGYNYDYDEEEILKRFENFVDQALLSCHHNSNLQTFYIEGDQADLPDKVVEWVGHAIARNVQQVKLESVQIEGPTLEFLCANLKCLALDGVYIWLTWEDEELLLNCPFMETLVLHSCSVGDYDYIFRKVKLSAPILKVLKFEGNMSSRNFTIDNLASIVTTVIDVDIYFGEDDDSDYDSNPEDSDPGDVLDNILRGLTNAKSLTLSLNNFLACSKVPITLSTVTTFQRLRYLKLKISSYSRNDWCFSTTLKLLEKCPNVETLVLDGYLELKTEVMEEDLVAELQSWCRHCHLKTLKIESEGIAITDCAFKFIKCIMRNAASLKNVVMTTLDTPMEQEKLLDICTRLKAKPKVTKISSQRIQVSLKPFIKIHWKSL